MRDDVLDRLMGQIHERARSLPEGSYTTKLMRGGVAMMGKKIHEEADEVVRAADEAGQEGRDHLVYEACDLIYHLWVMLGSRGVTVEELRSELARREGTSGIQEKEQRSKGKPPEGLIS